MSFDHSINCNRVGCFDPYISSAVAKTDKSVTCSTFYHLTVPSAVWSGVSYAPHLLWSRVAYLGVVVAACLFGLLHLTSEELHLMVYVQRSEQ